VLSPVQLETSALKPTCRGYFDSFEGHCVREQRTAVPRNTAKGTPQLRYRRVTLIEGEAMHLGTSCTVLHSSCCDLQLTWVPQQECDLHTPH
jgi:hypothetical protein